MGGLDGHCVRCGVLPRTTERMLGAIWLALAILIAALAVIATLLGQALPLLAWLGIVVVVLSAPLFARLLR